MKKLLVNRILPIVSILAIVSGCAGEPITTVSNYGSDKIETEIVEPAENVSPTPENSIAPASPVQPDEVESISPTMIETIEPEDTIVDETGNTESSPTPMETASIEAIEPVDDWQQRLQKVSGTYHVTGDVNLRSGPSKDYPKIKVLRSGENVSVVGKVDDWFQLENDGFVSGKFLAVGEAVAKKPVANIVKTNEEKKNIEPTAKKNSDVSPSDVKKDTTAKNAPDYRVEKVSGNYHTSAGANVRRGPGTGYAVVRSVAAGTNVSVDGKANGWFKLSGREEWISGKLLVSGEAPKKSVPTRSSGGSSSGSISGSNILWKAPIAGVMEWQGKPPCGGLWDYFPGIHGNGRKFYALEQTCAGSKKYLDLRKGDAIGIAGKTCRVVGSQDLNYKKHGLDDISWGNADTIIQTCYRGVKGPVKIIKFDCN